MLRITGGIVYDGTGSEPQCADVQIVGDRIAGIRSVADPDGCPPAAVGVNPSGSPGEDPAQTIDARGHWVLPGFIDVHSHADLSVLDPELTRLRHAAGVTTELVGQDGFGPVPCEERVWPDVASGLRAVAGEAPARPWTSVGVYLDECRRRAGSRVATLASHGTIRRHVVGREERVATANEIQGMRDRAEQLAGDGVPGLSSGLSYSPARAASVEEVHAVYQPFAEIGRPYVTHLRDYGEALDAALEEAARIAEGGWLHLTHLHVSGAGRGGTAERYLAWIAQQRERGLRVTIDNYPYTAACTFLASFLPSAALATPDPVATVGADRAKCAGALDAQGPGPTVAVGWEGFRLVGARLDGASVPDDTPLTEFASATGRTPGEAVVDLVVESGGGLAVLIEQGHLDNVRALVADPGHTVGSDGIMGSDVPHPRATGTFLRFLDWAHRGLVPVGVADMVARMTGRAAEVVGCDDLGVLAEGRAADVTILDPERLDPGPDRARYVPDAVRDLVIGGVVVRRDGEETGRLPGAIAQCHPARTEDRHG